MMDDIAPELTDTCLSLSEALSAGTRTSVPPMSTTTTLRTVTSMPVTWRTMGTSVTKMRRRRKTNMSILTMTVLRLSAIVRQALAPPLVLSATVSGTPDVRRVVFFLSLTLTLHSFWRSLVALFCHPSCSGCCH